MVPIIGRQRRIRLAEYQPVAVPDSGVCVPSRLVLGNTGRRAKYLAVELRDPVQGAGGHGKFDVRHSERHRTKTFVRSMTPDVVAPRTRPLYATAALPERELRPFQPVAHLREPGKELLPIGQHETDDPAQHLLLADRQMELRSPDIDPHIVD